MKKSMMAIAALSLTGCAYSQFKADYLHEYAAHDCGALGWELSAALEAEQKFKSRRKSERRVGTGTAGFNYQTSVSILGNSWPAGGAEGYKDPGASKAQETRMRNHARQQAISELLVSYGCRRDETSADIQALTVPGHSGNSRR